MFLNNSYFNLLRKIDKSWEERNSSRSNDKQKFRFWKKRISRSSSTLSSKSHTYSNSFSSGESGLYSGDINSGYYGDDEVDPCPKCNVDSPLLGAKADIDDFDVISIEVNVRKKRCKANGRRTTLNFESIDFEEFVVIPSAREQFCSGNFRHSTPLRNGRTGKESEDGSKIRTVTTDNLLVSCTPKIVASASPSTEVGGVFWKNSASVGFQNSCKCIATPQKPIRFRLYAPARSTSTGVWWKENITWQLRQRNKTQSDNFKQLQGGVRTSAKPKVRINRELADYLNKYGEFRPHNDALNNVEPNAIEMSEIIEAIRSHSGNTRATRLRSNSMAHRAKTYMESQHLAKDQNIKDTDDEDSYIEQRRRSRSKSQYRLLVPRWRESITNQLQMRNFLECKYFTDAIVRRTMSQLSVSESSQADSKSIDMLSDYDVIDEDDVNKLVANGKAVNTSESISQGYHSSPQGIFTIKDLDAVYAKNGN